MTETKTKKQSFRIDIDDQTHSVSTDGRQLQLILTADSKKAKAAPVQRTLWVSDLAGLNVMLVAKGKMRPWELQTYNDSYIRSHDLLSAFIASHEASKRKPFSVTFDRGGFVARWTPLTSDGGGGQWTLVNPAGTITRLPESTGNVGYYPSLFRAVWVAIERTVLASGETIGYIDLSRMVRETAEGLLADLKVEARR